MQGRTGLVVAGAGARGAYEAGAMSVLVPRMVDDGRPPTILMGTSAGALNVVGLAGFSADHGLAAATDKLVELWSSLHFSQVADVPASVAEDVVRFTGQLAGVPTTIPSLLDTRRLHETVGQLMPIDALHRAIQDGPIDAVGVAATSAASGATVVFVEKKPSVDLPSYDEHRNIQYVDTTLTLDHVLASAAVPVAFRPVLVDDAVLGPGWYVDGGARLNTPIKPAVRFDCHHLGVVATHPRTWLQPSVGLPVDPPDLFRAAALTLQGVMADGMVEDLWTLSKVNRLVSNAEEDGPDRQIDFLFAGPPADEAGAIGALANDVFERSFSGVEALHSPGLWLLERLVGGARSDHGDLLSFLFFESAFTSEAAALGRRHAERSLGAAPQWLTT